MNRPGLPATFCFLAFVAVSALLLRPILWPPFIITDGSVVVREPIECPNAAVAIGRAEGLCRILGHTGAVAFSRSGDPATGDVSDAKVIGKFGDVPDDLSSL